MRMEDERERPPDEDWKPANDNNRPGREGGDDADIAPWEKLDRVVLSIARLIGRRMAREDYEAALRAANDNGPQDDAGQLKTDCKD